MGLQRTAATTRWQAHRCQGNQQLGGRWLRILSGCFDVVRVQAHQRLREVRVEEVSQFREGGWLL